MSTPNHWLLRETVFEPSKQHHKETIFTVGNGYLSTRGAFEEGYPGDHRATFAHGVFDDAPVVVTELANLPDWLPLDVILAGERFSLDKGEILRFERQLDLRNGVLRRTVDWRSPAGNAARLVFERFVSLADPHQLYLRLVVIPEFHGEIEIRAAVHGYSDNEGLAHWEWVRQDWQGDIARLHSRTRTSHIQLVSAMRLRVVNQPDSFERWDAANAPTLAARYTAAPGAPILVEKTVVIYTSRDNADPAAAALDEINRAPDWETALTASTQAWQAEWQRCDVVIEGDPEAQLAVRFNLFQLLIAAPRHDEQVNIGAKTLSGFGYRGHAFWDTETFILPLFTYTSPQIARNLLSYRYHRLAGARRKAAAGGWEGALFPWESADTGDEVTPAWVPHFHDRTKLVRIWTGDIEYHISADIAYAAYQYWRASGDEAWWLERGAELVLDTAKFWATRAEWNAAGGYYEITDVIGPDEYHEHVDNNAFTNRLAQWNLEIARQTLDWLENQHPHIAANLRQKLDLTPTRLAHWQEVSEKLIVLQHPDGLIEQFTGYFQRKDINLEELEPRDRSVQVIFGIEGTNQTQVLKQPDVLMLLYMLREAYDEQILRVNYDYYNPRTDHTFGSSLGPSIMAIMACWLGDSEAAYEHFSRALRADLYDVRGNAGDGIHAASAGGVWQALVFGFAGLRLTEDGWSISAQLPSHWRRLSFHFYWHGELQQVDIRI